MLKYRCILAVVLSLVLAHLAHAQRKPTKADAEDEYYKLLRFEIPPGEVLEPGAFEPMPDGKMAVGTRRGEIWMIENPYAKDPEDAKFTRFAHGLHEVLGLAQKDGWLYVTCSSLHHVIGRLPSQTRSQAPFQIFRFKPGPLGIPGH